MWLLYGRRSTSPCAAERVRVSLKTETFSRGADEAAFVASDERWSPLNSEGGALFFYTVIM